MCSVPMTHRDHLLGAPHTIHKYENACVLLCMVTASFSYHKLICYCCSLCFLDNLCVSIKIYCRIRALLLGRFPSSSVCKFQKKTLASLNFFFARNIFFPVNRIQSFIGWILIFFFGFSICLNFLFTFFSIFYPQHNPFTRSNGQRSECLDIVIYTFFSMENVEENVLTVY